MTGRPARLRALAVQLVCYGVFGGLGALSDFLLYSVLVGVLEVPPLHANVVSVGLGILVSFWLNSHYTFQRTDNRRKRLARFVIVGTVGLVTSTALLATLVHGFAVDPLLAKPLTMGPVVAFQFLMNRRWSFGEISSPAQPGSRQTTIAVDR